MIQIQSKDLAGCEAVQLDEEEITSALLGASLASRHYRDKAANAERFKEPGWRHQKALCMAGIEAADSVSSKLGLMRQFKLGFRAWAVGIAGVTVLALSGCGTIWRGGYNPETGELTWGVELPLPQKGGLKK